MRSPCRHLPTVAVVVVAGAIMEEYDITAGSVIALGWVIAAVWAVLPVSVVGAGLGGTVASDGTAACARIIAGLVIALGWFIVAVWAVLPVSDIAAALGAMAARVTCLASAGREDSAALPVSDIAAPSDKTALDMAASGTAAPTPDISGSRVARALALFVVLKCMASAIASVLF